MRDWGTYDYAPSAMLHYLVNDRKIAAKLEGVRKLRLAMVGMCRQIWDYLPGLEHRKAVELAEAFADRLIKPADCAAHRRHYENALEVLDLEYSRQMEVWIRYRSRQNRHFDNPLEAVTLENRRHVQNRDPGREPEPLPDRAPLTLAVLLLSPNRSARELIRAYSAVDAIWWNAHPLDPDLIPTASNVFTDDEPTKTISEWGVK